VRASRQIGHIHSSFTKDLRDSTADLKPFCALCALSLMAGGAALMDRALDTGNMLLIDIWLRLIVDVMM